MTDDDDVFDPEKFIHPHFDLVMRDNKTGETKTVRMDDRWYEHSFWMWTEGNFCCDCNRGMFFYGNNEDYPCGAYWRTTQERGTQRFPVFSVKFPDGTAQLIDPYEEIQK
jgi:hypothetical protein